MGISLVDSYKATKKKTYKKHAKKYMTKLNDYAKKGNPNVQHYKLALEGEMLVLKNKTTEATSRFEKAIALATRFGFIHDAALMNERYGEFLMETDAQRGMHHVIVAYTLYTEWGARKKAEMVRDKYPSQWAHPLNEIRLSAGLGSAALGSAVSNNSPSGPFDSTSELLESPSELFNTPSRRFGAPSERFGAPSGRFSMDSARIRAHRPQL